MSQVTGVLADFVTKIAFDRLPKPVVKKTKQILLDCIGCAMGSYAIDRARITLELVDDFGGRPEATIIGNHKTSSVLAAFANGELINALDYEPTGPLTPHTCPYVFPSALAIGERVSASGKELITALALAMEVGGRVSSSMSQQKILIDEPPYYKKPDRYSFTPTIFGGVAGACKLLHLDSGQVANAFGIAGASTPVPAGMKALHLEGLVNMVKYNCWTGWIAQLATTATLAAERGFTGDPTILDGEWGFWKIYGSPFFKQDHILNRLGETWHIEEVNFKAYPCCGLNQSAVDGINRIMLENRIEPENIEKILIKGDPMLLQANHVQTEIKSFEDTQFCNAFIAAVAVFHGRQPSPVWQTRIVSEDPRIKNLMKKVEVEIHPKASEAITSGVKAGKTTAFRGATVEVTAAGRKFVVEVTAAKGTPGNPLNDQELLEKFRNNASYSMLKRSKTEKVIEAIYELEKIDDIREVMRLLAIE